MPKSGISFQTEDKVDFSLDKESKIKSWIKSGIQQEGKKPGNIAYLFCTDKYLLKINQQFLKHDFYTDIITFDYSEKEKIEGEIFISVDRVKDNARKYKQPFQEELLRTIIHGVLHLCGYKDKSPADKKTMRKKEDAALSNYKR